MWRWKWMVTQQMSLTKLTLHADNPEWQTVGEILLSGNKRFPADSIHSLSQNLDSWMFPIPISRTNHRAGMQSMPIGWNCTFLNPRLGGGVDFVKEAECVSFFLVIKLVPVIFWCSLVSAFHISFNSGTSPTVLIVYKGLKWLRFPNGLLSNASQECQHLMILLRMAMKQSPDKRVKTSDASATPHFTVVPIKAINVIISFREISWWCSRVIRFSKESYSVASFHVSHHTSF